MLKPTANSGERLYITVARRLEQAIEAGTYPVGSRLPAERELSDRLGVSRPVIREALIVLEIRGYISVRPNGGTVVASRDARSGPTPAMQPDAGPFEGDRGTAAAGRGGGRACRHPHHRRPVRGA